MASAISRFQHVAIGCLLLVVLAGCDWRLETEEVPFPTPDAATIARDQAALAEAAVLDAIEAHSRGDVREAALAGLVGPVAKQHLALLGGVYVEFPDASPSPSATPVSGLSVEQAVTAARDLAILHAYEDSRSEAGFFAGVRGFTYAFALWYAASVEDSAAGGSPLLGEERMFPSSTPLDATALPEVTDLSALALADLALAHDKARFLYEVLAARSADQARIDALTRAEIHANRAEALATVAGIDPREPIYSLPDASVNSSDQRAATARATEQALGWRYLELTFGVDNYDRAWLLNAAFDAYTASVAVGGFTVAEFPVLPGLVAVSDETLEAS